MRCLAKILIAVIALGTIARVAASQVLPAMPVWKVLLGAVAIAALVFVVALVHACIAGSLRALLLRWGAIDTQWLWGPDYPEGFKRHGRRGTDMARE